MFRNPTRHAWIHHSVWQLHVTLCSSARFHKKMASRKSDWFLIQMSACLWSSCGGVGRRAGAVPDGWHTLAIAVFCMYSSSGINLIRDHHSRGVMEYIILRRRTEHAHVWWISKHRDTCAWWSSGKSYSDEMGWEIYGPGLISVRELHSGTTR